MDIVKLGRNRMARNEPHYAVDKSWTPDDG
jgi:hypothetical protein